MLERGANGDAVAAVQRMLAFLGYRGQRKRGDTIELVPIKDDGEYGELTESAVLAFQTDRGLHADGRVSETTMDALAEAFSARQSGAMGLADLLGGLVGAIPETQAMLDGANRRALCLAGAADLGRFDIPATMLRVAEAEVCASVVVRRSSELGFSLSVWPLNLGMAVLHGRTVERQARISLQISGVPLHAHKSNGGTA
jgi:hypothetical protein